MESSQCIERVILTYSLSTDLILGGFCCVFCFGCVCRYDTKRMVPERGITHNDGCVRLWELTARNA